MTEPTMEEYMTKTREDYGSWIARLKFKPKGQFLKELRDNTFSGSENKDANEHIERVLEIVDLFTTAVVTQDQLMLRVFPISLTGAASRWLRNEPTGSITNWEILKGKFLSKYCPPSRTAKRMEEINNFQQEPDETLYQEEGKTLEEAYYTQFGVPFPNAERYRAVASGFYQIDNENPSYQKRRQTMEESLSKFMTKSAKRHDGKSFLIKEIRASTDAAIKNQRASI
nr:hypothetical protein [Tanacetum cinerariifolium]